MKPEFFARRRAGAPCRISAKIAFWKAMGYQEYSLCLEIMPQPSARR